MLLLTVKYTFFGLARSISIKLGMRSSELFMTHHSETRYTPSASKVERGEMRAVKRVMIGPSGTVDLHVPSATGYEERQQWGGREGASTALFDQCCFFLYKCL